MNLTLEELRRRYDRAMLARAGCPVNAPERQRLEEEERITREAFEQAARAARSEK